MSNDPDSPSVRKPPDSKPSGAEARQAERAAALRANLMRRKAQARGRSETQDDPQSKSLADA
jgi:hypothetical protein